MSHKIIVCQTGARHRYMIPRIIENNGDLYRVYTDTTYYSICGKIATCINRFFKNKLIQRLIERKPPIPVNKLYTTDILLFKKLWYRLFSKDSLKQRFLHYNGFTNKCKRWGIGKADCIYNMYIENFEFIKYAKSKGLKIIIDIYEAPNTFEILLDEINRTPQYQVLNHLIPSYTYSQQVRMFYIEKLLNIADIYTIPSIHVEKTLSRYHFFNKEKVYLLPYASSFGILEYQYNPIKHRIIWVGNNPIIKGLIYCSKAADILKLKYPTLDFRIIGSIDNSIKQSPHFNNLNFIGTLNKEDLIKEYRAAEVYVFPTLSEGMAGTIIEAASCGCPIITTECSGMSPDFPAIYINTRDVNAIVESVINIFENTKYRNELSLKVYEYSSQFSQSKYEERLTNLIRCI